MDAFQLHDLALELRGTDLKLAQVLAARGLLPAAIAKCWWKYLDRLFDRLINELPPNAIPTFDYDYYELIDLHSPDEQDALFNFLLKVERHLRVKERLYRSDSTGVWRRKRKRGSHVTSR